MNFSVRMTVTENTIPYMFENICYLHEHGLDNICMIMGCIFKKYLMNEGRILKNRWDKIFFAILFG